MEIKVLGSGCSNCNKLYETALKAVEQSGVQAEVEKIEEIDQIMSYGVMLTPALVIDGNVMSTGKIPDSSQIVTWLTTAVS